MLASFDPAALFFFVERLSVANVLPALEQVGETLKCFDRTLPAFFNASAFEVFFAIVIWIYMFALIAVGPFTATLGIFIFTSVDPDAGGVALIFSDEAEVSAAFFLRM